MTSRFSELAVDCHDPQRLAAFWCAALGYDVLDDDGDLVEIGHAPLRAELLRDAPQAPTIVFAKVPEGKTVKNRLHIDLSPSDATNAEEVDRLIALGASRVDVGQGDVPWTVLADPEGNEFCVLRSLDDWPA